MLCAGLGLMNWLFIAPNSSPGTTQLLGYLAAILSLLCVPLGIVYFRDKLNDGVVSFAQGFKVGLGISLILSLVVFCYSVLFFVFAGDDYRNWQAKALNETELKEFQMKIEQMPEYVLSPWFQGFLVFLSVFLIGVIISLISSLFLKRSPTS